MGERVSSFFASFLPFIIFLAWNEELMTLIWRADILKLGETPDLGFDHWCSQCFLHWVLFWPISISSTLCAEQGNSEIFASQCCGRLWACSHWSSSLLFVPPFWNHFDATCIPTAKKPYKALMVFYATLREHIWIYAWSDAWYAFYQLAIWPYLLGSSWRSCPRGCKWQMWISCELAHS